MPAHKPYIITFPKIGESDRGFISVAENKNLPFEVKRIYWTYYTPENVERGGHAHYALEQILLAVAGKVIVRVETQDGNKEEFVLESPDTGLYIPRMAWRTMKYTHSSVQVCLASIAYEESDYIRNYKDFTDAIKHS